MSGPTNGANGTHSTAAAVGLGQPAAERPMTEGEPTADSSVVLTSGPMLTLWQKDEIALYDRQIRLWGMSAQEKLRSAHVLLVTMRALGNEIAKDLVLAGIGALTIADHEDVIEEDLGAQFLLAPASMAGDRQQQEGEGEGEAAAAAAAAVVGTNRAAAASNQLRAMNPRVAVSVEQTDVSTKPPSFFAQFTLVVVTDRDPSALDRINTAARVVDRPFYAASTYGYYGFIFADLIEHEFVITRDRGNVAPVPGTKETRTRVVVDVKLLEEKGEDAADAGAPKSNSNAPTVEAVTKRELYSTWMLSSASPLPATIRNSPRRLRNVLPCLPCLRALWAFQELYEDTAKGAAHVPDPRNGGDLRQFVSLVNEKQKQLGVPEVKADTITDFFQGIAQREISSVVTAVGGEAAQDIINTLGHSQQPIQNLAVFDGARMEFVVYALHPDGDLGRGQLSTAPRTDTGETSPEAATAVLAAAAKAGAVGPGSS